jgi:hypothetical protein
MKVRTVQTGPTLTLLRTWLLAMLLAMAALALTASLPQAADMAGDKSALDFPAAAKTPCNHTICAKVWKRY